MIVADTNLLVYFLVPGVDTPTAESVRAKEKIWAAPPLLPYELLNVLARYVHKGDFDRDEAARLYRRGLAMIEISVLRPEPTTILRMSEQSGCSTYDVEYVWLAQELDVNLVTADKAVVRSYPDVAVSPSRFV